MRILYAIQGTGNGHVSRARDIIPELKKKCEVDILISGKHSEIQLDYKIDYNLNGMGFVFGKRGGVDLWRTFIESNFSKFYNEVNLLPVEDYDFVINDFEPVSAWACYRRKVPCVSLSHQSAILHHNAPQPKKKDGFGMFILKNYAPSSVQFGFHFKNYAENIFTPVIRKEIRDLETDIRDHFTVYLPSYDDQRLIKHFSRFKNFKWEVFSKHTKTSQHINNILIRPINNEDFIYSMASSRGVLCGAGFETPAEALYLGKKLMVIPMKAQVEQHFNATALKEMGVPVLKKLKKKHYEKLEKWLTTEENVNVFYPDNTSKVINKIFEDHILKRILKTSWKEDYTLEYPDLALNKN
jgi:uncharacterized protein (TIGR00661 family)